MTGAFGFLGRELVSQLATRGDTVIATDADIPDQLAPNSRVSWCRLDVTNGDEVHRLIEANRIDRIAHLAYILPPVSETRPAKAVLVNCGGSAHLFEAALRYKDLRLVWTSSMSVYGPARHYSQPVDEDSETSPRTVYGATKVLVEKAADACRRLGANIVGLRFNLVFGPGRVRGLGPFITWGRDLIERPAAGLAVRVPAADHEADWIYVRDAARAIRLAFSPNATRGVYNVLGERTTARRVAELVKSLIPSCQIELLDGGLGVDAEIPRFNGLAAERDLGYSPTFDMREALIDYLHHLGPAHAKHSEGAAT